MDSIRPSLLLLCFVSGAPVLAQGHVLVVDDDPGPGVNYTQISAAIAAAHDGDAVFVHPGTYAPFEIDGKALVVQGEGAVVVDSFRVRHVTQDVAVRGLSVPNTARASAGILVEDSTGTVWIEDCVVDAPPATCGAGERGILVRGAQSVVLIHTSASGSDLPFVEEQGVTCSPPAEALSIQGSKVHAFDCSFRGGKGGEPTTGGGSGGPGASGVAIDGGFLFLSASSVQGGDGGSTDPTTCRAGEGGTGLELLQNAPLVQSLGTTIGGGAGGAGCGSCGCPVSGTAGPPTRISTGGMGASNATPLTMRTSPAPREFSSVQLDFQGPPGVPVLLAIDAQPFPLYLAAAKSSVLIPAPPVIFTLGVTSPAGVLHFVFPTRRNLAGQGVPYYAQAAYLDPAGGGVLGTGSMLLLLDEDY